MHSRNPQKHFKKRESQNLTMNEIVQKHFQHTEPQKLVRILGMNENQVKPKIFVPFLHCTR
jgi:hypothetical protein